MPEAAPDATLREQIVELAIQAFDPSQQFIGKICQTIGYGKEQIVVRPDLVLALHQDTVQLLQPKKQII